MSGRITKRLTKRMMFRWMDADAGPISQEAGRGYPKGTLVVFKEWGATEYVMTSEQYDAWEEEYHKLHPATFGERLRAIPELLGFYVGG